MATARAPAVQKLAPRVLELLPGSQSEIAIALKRRKNDGTVRRTLEYLATQGFAERANGTWKRCQAEPTEPAAELAHPDDFDQESRALFGKVIVYVRGLPEGLWDETMISLAERFVRSKQLAREAREAAKAAGGYQRSSGGRVFKHPGIEDARQHERDAHTFAEALLLTPKSRQQAGVKDGGGGADPFDF